MSSRAPARIVRGTPIRVRTGPARALRLALLPRSLFTTLAALILAGILHIVIILTIPRLAEYDAYSLYRDRGRGGYAELVASSNTPTELREADPAVILAVCGYDLEAGPLRVAARVDAWRLSLSVHRRGGGVLYAITSRAAVNGLLEFEVMTVAQDEEEPADDDDGETSRLLRVIADSPQGLIVVRVLARLPSERAPAVAAATRVACTQAR